MEIKVHDNAKTVGEAFTGVDKMEGIHDNLKELVSNDNSPRTSDVIKLAIELYGDTTEDAVGIALEVKYLMNMRDDKERLINIFENTKHKLGSPMKETADVLKDLLSTADPTSAPYTSLQAKILSDMGRQKCEECSVNGDCPTQDIADKMAPEWREGRDL